MKLFNKKMTAVTDTDLDLPGKVDTALSAFVIEPAPTILDRSASVVSSFLDDARARRASLMNQRARIDEELRQTDIAIEAFEPVLLKLDDGYDAADDARKCYEVAIEAKRKRSKPDLVAAAE